MTRNLWRRREVNDPVNHRRVSAATLLRQIRLRIARQTSSCSSRSRSSRSSPCTRSSPPRGRVPHPCRTPGRSVPWPLLGCQPALGVLSDSHPHAALGVEQEVAGDDDVLAGLQALGDLRRDRRAASRSRRCRGSKSPPPLRRKPFSAARSRSPHQPGQ